MYMCSYIDFLYFTKIYLIAPLTCMEFQEPATSHKSTNQSHDSSDSDSNKPTWCMVHNVTQQV